MSPAYTCHRPGELLGKSLICCPRDMLLQNVNCTENWARAFGFSFRPVLGVRLCRGGEGRLGSVGVLKRRPQETVLQGRGLACGPVLPDVVIAVLLHLYKKERTFA